MAYNPGYVDGTIVTSNANYVPGVGLRKVYDDISSAITYWIYVTSDSITAVQATGYISDAAKKRLKVGDIVDVFTGTLASQAATATSGATLGAITFPATVGVASLFTSAPTYQRMMVTAVSSAGAGTIASPNVTSSAAVPKNFIQGGDFSTNPWQIGTSFNGTSATPTLTADRWNANSGNSLTWTAGRTSNTSVQGFTAAYVWGRSVGDTHTTGLTLGQVIETANSYRAQGLPVTLSFWAAADANFAAGASGGTFIASIISGTGINESSGKMMSGAWSGCATVGTTTITPTTAATRYLVGGTVGTGATQLGVVFSYTATTAATSPGLTAGTHESLQFMGAQLEIGGATPFEHSDVSIVVDQCTRYLQVINEPTVHGAVGQAVFSASSLAQVYIPLAAPMRSAPTLTFTAGGFVITDSALGAHAVTGANVLVASTGGVTLAVTAATTLSAGLVSMMEGRSTNSGIIILTSDF
jgi:hypothetical protein